MVKFPRRWLNTKNIQFLIIFKQIFSLVNISHLAIVLYEINAAIVKSMNHEFVNSKFVS